MNTPCLKRLFTIFLFLLIMVPVFAQKNEKVPRNLYVFPAVSTGEAVQAGEYFHSLRGKGVKKLFEVLIARAGGIIIVEDEKEMDCWIKPVINYKETVLTIDMQLFDILADSEILSESIPLPDFSLITLSARIETHGIETILNLLPPRDPEIVEVVTEKVVEDVQVKKVYIEEEGVEAVIRALPGTLLRFKTGEEYRIDDSGSLVLDLPINSFHAVSAEKEGYFPVKEEITLKEKPFEILLKQETVKRWGIDTGFRLIDVSICPGIQYFYKPNYNYVSFALVQNFLSIASLTNVIFQYEQPSLFFIMPGIGTGWYFFSPLSIARLGLSAEIYTRIVFPRNSKPFFSKATPLCLMLGVSGELSPWKTIRFYLRWQPTLHMKFHDVILSDYYQWAGYYPALYIHINNRLGLNLMSFNLGARLLL